MLRAIAKHTPEWLVYEVARRVRIARSGRLARLGDPRTLVDVGAGHGTPELYRAFPRAELILLEPLVEFERDLRHICQKQGRGRYVLAAAGARKGRSEIWIDPSRLQSSSFFTRTTLTKSSAELQQRTVDVTTLDDLLAEQSFQEPFGLKIDTEGFELDVIKGASNFLKSTAFVIAEVSILKRFEGSYRFEEFIEGMMRHGFHVFDILNVVRPDPRGTRYADIAFLNPKCAVMD
jgi:FkbM family methyltransferase